MIQVRRRKFGKKIQIKLFKFKNLGILCGSEPDQQSLNNRRSHESLDSGETEQSEGEECMEIVETTSMDEDYRELQSDLCLYPTQPLSSSTATLTTASIKLKDEPVVVVEEQLDAINDRKIRYRELNMNKAAILKEKYHQTICVPIEFEEEPTAAVMPTICDVIKEEVTIVKEVVKDPKDPMFKSFFKNAIFRTAQSIIENHEKKNAKKEQVACDSSTATTSTNNSSTPQQKKLDFLLKSRSKNQPHQQPTLTTSASAEISSVTTPIEKSRGMSKSSSTSSLTMKVPGTACMVKETIQPQIKTERGQSGLLRFFESPVFNIHFAIHYLFYSKEPGVLSFIGNKIFR